MDLKKKNIKLTLEYDGSNYSGWQVQSNAKTVQGELYKACEKIFNQEIKMQGASRTDAGVHAKGYVANILVNTNIPMKKIPLALNSKLETSIRVLKAEEVFEEFHARYHAKRKTYVYQIFNRDSSSPFHKRVWHVPKNLNLENMKKASEYLIGTHDFTSFKAIEKIEKNTTRTIFELNIEKSEHLIKMTITGNAFLYNMVRIIAGTLVDVGLGKKKPEDVEKILKEKNRLKAGKTAPAEGLTLYKIEY